MRRVSEAMALQASWIDCSRMAKSPVAWGKWFELARMNRVRVMGLASAEAMVAVIRWLVVSGPCAVQ